MISMLSSMSAEEGPSQSAGAAALSQRHAVDQPQPARDASDDPARPAVSARFWLRHHAWTVRQSQFLC